MINYKNLLFILILFILRISLSCKAITEQDTISVASEPDYPPFCIIDEKGNAKGSSVDLFRETAAAVNMPVKFKVDTWNKIKQELADGEIDELKHKVFEKGFYHGHSGHTGLGLYIVKNTISDFGGFVYIEDNKPNGAIFIINLQNAKEFSIS